jgi:hypothetical protein
MRYPAGESEPAPWRRWPSHARAGRGPHPVRAAPGAGRLRGAGSPCVERSGGLGGGGEGRAHRPCQGYGVREAGPPRGWTNTPSSPWAPPPRLSPRRPWPSWLTRRSWGGTTGQPTTFPASSSRPLRHEGAHDPGPPHPPERAPRGDQLWYSNAYDAAEVLRRVRYLEPAWGFREQYGYQNIMFAAAGERGAPGIGYDHGVTSSRGVSSCRWG